MTTFISKSNLTIKMGSKIIIDNSDLVIRKNMRYGLVGLNGCGKTSLINYIRSNLDESIKAYIVDQHIEFDNPNQTVFDFMLRADPNIYITNQKVKLLEQIEEMSDIEFETYDKLTNSTEYMAYEQYQIQSKKILKGLGIVNYESLVSTYSGGWRMRLAIAKSLIIKPQLLIMDEPTNHLDLNAVIWLSDYLGSYKNTLIIASHQIDFINRFSNTILYIGAPDFRLPKLYTINGSYDKLCLAINDISKAATASYTKVENEIKRLKSKSKSKAEIQAYITKSNVARPPKPYEIKIGFIDVPIIENKSVIKFTNVDFGYDQTNPNNQTNTDKHILLKDSNFEIKMDDRFVIVGPNGIGKTTLFKLCLNMIQPTKGHISIDSRIRIGYYNQQIIENLPLEQTPIEYLQQLDPQIKIENCRRILAMIGLKRDESNDPCTIPIKLLSGGQKARVSFCAIQVKSPHIILFDEPTNHLDIESIDGLIQGINSYNGGIVMITHDIYLISNVNHIQILEFKNQSINKFNGMIEDYVQDVINDE
jgi:ATPase subunit of ABC transporter with duplicated ATPase domains